MRLLQRSAAPKALDPWPEFTAMTPVAKPVLPDTDFTPAPVKRPPTPLARHLAGLACFGASLLGGPIAILLTRVVLGLDRNSGLSDPWGALGVLALLTAWVAAAISWADPRDRFGVVALVVAGLVLGVAMLFLLIFVGIFVIFLASSLGVVAGLIAMVPCWNRGDRTGRAMALIGITPGLPFLVGFLLAR